MMSLFADVKKEKLVLAQTTIDLDGSMVLHGVINNEAIELHINPRGQMLIRQAVEQTREVFEKELEEMETGRGR